MLNKNEGKHDFRHKNLPGIYSGWRLGAELTVEPSFSVFKMQTASGTKWPIHAMESELHRLCFTRLFFNLNQFVLVSYVNYFTNLKILPLKTEKMNF